MGERDGKGQEGGEKVRGTKGRRGEKTNPSLYTLTPDHPPLRKLLVNNNNNNLEGLEMIMLTGILLIRISINK